MKFIPKQYQSDMIEEIKKHPNIALFADMGLGKTVVTLTWIAHQLSINSKFKTLIIAPLNVALTTWLDEVNKWDHLQHLKIISCCGNSTERIKAFKTPADIYIINRENSVWMVENINTSTFDALILDELSSFKATSSYKHILSTGKTIHIFGSRRFNALAQIRRKFKYCIGLTGTPTPNSYLELWPQIYLIDQGQTLGKVFWAYRNKYFTEDMYTWRLKPNAQNEILDKMKAISVSLKAEDYLNMPDKIYNDIKIHIPNEKYIPYLDMLRKHSVNLSDSQIDAENVTIKLLQLASGFIYDDEKNIIKVHDQLLLALDEILEFESSNILLFYNFKAEEKFILSRYPAARKLQSTLDFDDWNKGRIRLAIAHPASCGHGLNLQKGGNVIVWYGLNWSLELTQQAEARLYRQGQASTFVRIHRLIPKNTIVETVKLYLSQKIDRQELLLKAVKLLREI